MSMTPAELRQERIDRARATRECPVCHAQPGSNCRMRDANDRWNEYTGREYTTSVHLSRTSE